MSPKLSPNPNKLRQPSQEDEHAEIHTYILKHTERERSEMEREEVEAMVSSQWHELSIAMTAESDLDYSFDLQMQEAINASLSLLPTSSSLSPYRNEDDIVVEEEEPSFVTHFTQEIERFAQERLDREMAEAHMMSIQDDLNRRIHDQVFAHAMSRIPDEEWVKTGDHFNQPYGEGTSSAEEAYRLYCKGLVREEMVGGVKSMVAGIGIAICDARDGLVFEMRKPLVSSALSSDFSEVKAVIEGLNAVLTLGIKRVNILCDNALLHQYVTGASKPIQGNMTTLVGQISLLQKKFSYCVLSLVSEENMKFVVKLAHEAIVSQLTWPTQNSDKKLKKTCLICLEDVDVSKMFCIDGCQHSYCPSCIKQHAEVKLFEGKLPKCPHAGCTIELKIETCKKLFEPELFDMLSQRLKEASIPAKDKVYCPNPNCSVLMTISEALASADEAGASKCVKCHDMFCLKCKVPWHKNLNCDDYKKSYPFPCAEDAKLDSLATKKLWRQCVMCKSMVELAEGCYHIYCRCGYEFCYTCGAEWKKKKATCKCPIWDEENIIRS